MALQQLNFGICQTGIDGIHLYTITIHLLQEGYVKGFVILY